MRVTIPKRGEVHSAFKALLGRLGESIKQVNERAAKRMRRGDYDGAERWVQIGTNLGEFRKRVFELREGWGALCLGARRKKHQAAKRGRGPSTPLWEFYQPILQAIVRAGGQAPRKEIEGAVFELIQTRLQPGDLEASGGRTRWQNSIRRARKQLIKEGWLSADGSKDLWRVTEKGRAAATRQRPQEQA